MQRGQWCPVTGRTEVLRYAGEVIQSLFPALQHRSVICPAEALGPRLVLLRDSTDPGKQSTAAVQVLNNNSHSLCQRRDFSTACFCRSKWLRTSPQKTIWQEGKLRKSGGLPSGWGRNLAAAALAGHCGGSWGVLPPHTWSPRGSQQPETSTLPGGCRRAQAWCMPSQASVAQILWGSDCWNHHTCLNGVLPVLQDLHC